MEASLVPLSRFLSLVLRHRPQSIGLELDREGWADIDALIAAARLHGRHIEASELAAVVAGNDKKRFALSGDGRRIRAVQGHSTPAVAIAHVAKTPPARLFHGTATRFLESILATGLRAGSRHHVHLSADESTAVGVGARHGRPVVLVVDAAAMHAAGHVFFQADNGVWLTPSVPVSFLRKA